MPNFDKIIAGERNGITVYYEDFKCIAIKDFNPVSSEHFLVISKVKKNNYASLDEADPEVIGHLMYVAS